MRPRDAVPVVDVHAHTLPVEGFPDGEPPEGNSVTLPGGKRVGPFPDGMFSVAERLTDMEAVGITHQALSPPPFAFFYDAAGSAAADLARHQNDAMVRVAADHPASFSVLATLPLQDTRLAVGEVERLAGVDEVRGVVVGSNVNGEDLDANRFEPLWRALTDADLGVFVHPVTTVVGGDRVRPHFLRNLFGNPADTTLAIMRLIYGGVLERHPDLRVCLSHGGGFAPFQIGRWDRGWATRDEVAPGMPHPPSDYLASAFYDLIVHDQAALAFLGARMGWSQMVMGTDYPFVMGVDDPVSDLDALHLTEADTALVRSGNAERFLRGLGRGDQASKENGAT